MISLTDPNEYDLPEIARGSFDAALEAVNPEKAVRRRVRIESDVLFVADCRFDLRRFKNIYAIALGKAALKMARGLNASLGGRLCGGVISCPSPSSEDNFVREFSDVWQIFRGGHPLPNRASVAAAQATIELLGKTDATDSLVIFLVSGGGSAMLELPADERITLAELREANRVLVTCGATIAEVNALRRRLSKVKGGGLSRAAGNAQKITLIVSDTNDGEDYNVASGPTVAPEKRLSDEDLKELINRYDLRAKLSQIIFDCLKNPVSKKTNQRQETKNEEQILVLLNNDNGVRAARKFLLEKDFVVETANDLIETPIAAGCAELIERLLTLREKTPREKTVALVSGGEFVCPVRGGGSGGRNAESALRTAILFDELKKAERWKNVKFAALYAGTDGIDGNSPAAGATADETTLDRARELNLNAAEFLTNSDAYSFFRALGDAIETGATGTNVRDIRILVAS